MPTATEHLGSFCYLLQPRFIGEYTNIMGMGVFSDREKIEHVIFAGLLYFDYAEFQ